MSTTDTVPRLDMTALVGGPYAAMARVEERIELDPTIRHLVRMRASIRNGCAFCLDMHWAHAIEDGEREQRLLQVAAWREAPCFDDRERAALALTDALTGIADGHLPHEVLDEARARFSDAELANLLFQIATINAWNRVAIGSGAVPASFAAA